MCGLGDIMKQMHRAIGWLALGLGVLAVPVGAVPADAEQPLVQTSLIEDVGLLPPREAWTATSSGLQEDQYGPALAIDGDTSTRWSSPASDPQWLTIDIGREAVICGAVLRWETAYADAYDLDVSTDGESWQTVYTCRNGDGQTDDIYFSPVKARYLRIMGRTRATGWGYSLWDVDVRDIQEAPLVRVDGELLPAGHAIFDGDRTTGRDVPVPGTVEIDLHTRRDLGGIRIDWGDRFASHYTIRSSIDGQTWTELEAVDYDTGGFNLILHPRTDVRFLRVNIEKATESESVSLNEISFKAPEEEVTPLRRFELAAMKAPSSHYPGQFRREQVYWTLFGIPGSKKESLIDEYGAVEPYQGRPVLTPFLRIDGVLRGALDASSVTRSLADGWIPLPGVAWEFDDIILEIDTAAAGGKGDAVSLVQYKIRNPGTETVEGECLLTVRPFQATPVWQYGGLAPIRNMKVEVSSDSTCVTINDEPLYHLYPAATGAGVHRFLRGDVVEALEAGGMPEAGEGIDEERGLLSGAAAYPFRLAPGESMQITALLPLHGSGGDEADTGAAAFSQARARQLAYWREVMGEVSLELPDRSVTDTVRSQIAYILLNMDGRAIQPGSRNYKRSWIRDGGITSVAMMRMGALEPARDFLSWYAQRIYPNGMVPPILDNDGTVNTGYGSDLEYDSQGQFIYALMEYTRLSGDDSLLRNHYEDIVKAMQFMQELRERTLVDGYMADHPRPDRFAGLFPPSYSHEGYNPPMHSYWDTFWGLLGWKEGMAAARRMGRTEDAVWAEEQYDLLAGSVSSTIAAVIDFKSIDFIPGCAEKGDPDPTSTAIALSPCRIADLLPGGILTNTFDRYYHDLMSRREPGWEGTFTPYEIRSVTAFQSLGQPDRAAELLDYLMSCRRPPAWNHLAEVVIGDERKGGYIGDMPHTWVGSGLVNSVRLMLVREVDGRLVLLEGAPASWLQGEGIRLSNLPTHFGRITLNAKERDGNLIVDWSGISDPPEGIALRNPIDGTITELPPATRAWTP